MLELSYRFQTLHDDSITVRYNLGSVATLKALPECPYVDLRHADFKLTN